MPRMHKRHKGVAMKTWLMMRTGAGLALVLAATMFASGTTIGSEPESESIDPATQAAWVYDHFLCEHAAEMAEA